jgi:O-antigen/teichoic acid export membrane protein
MQGVQGLWLIVYANIISAIFSLGLGFILIPKFGVAGLALTLIVFYAICLGVMLFHRKIFFAFDSSCEPKVI